MVGGVFVPLVVEARQVDPFLPNYVEENCTLHSGLSAKDANYNLNSTALC